MLHVRRAYNKHEGVFRDYPKGKRQHSHRIPLELLTLLKRAKLKAVGDLVVVSPNYKMLEYGKYHEALRNYCTEVGITVVATHGLRHSTSELYMSHGATRDDLKLLFAHSSNTTTDRYVHDKGTRLTQVANVIQLFPDDPQMIHKVHLRDKI
jgi:integrase